MIGNSEGRLKGRGIASAAIPAGALGEDKTDIPVLVAKLQKKSSKGRWQGRYFRANNHYLSYYKTSKLAKICCCHDIVQAIKIEAIGRFGYFEVEFKDNTVSLKAKDLDEAESWVENLIARKELFQNERSGSRSGDNNSNEINADGSRVKRANTGLQGGILLEGYLSKKSPSRFVGFQERYFILGNGLLRYYKIKPDDNEDGSIDDDMQGALHIAGLHGTNSVLPLRTDKDGLTFVLQTEGREFELKALTRDSCIEWINAIDQAR